MVTWLSRPSERSIMKKRTAQKGAYGRFTTAAGYATKARPQPVGKQTTTKIELKH